MEPVMPGRVNPSMMDVARYAGVSIATVSNVINRPEKVAAGTADRVRTAIADLGFVRNDQARSLATGRTRSLGMVLADLDNSLFVDLAHGAQEAADAAGLRVLLGSAACDLERQDDYLDLFDEARVGGVLLAPMEDSLPGIERMRAHGRPIVLLNYKQTGADCCTVLVDNEEVGYLAARHLIDSGRRHIAFVAGRDYYQPVHARREGFRRAVAGTSGIRFEEVDTPGIGFDDGLGAATAFLERQSGDVPDGIVAVTDAIGNGICEGLRAAPDFSVPERVSVVGCEDNRSAHGGPVALTAVQLAGVEMGEAAVELLLDEIQGGNKHRHRTITLRPNLIVRASTSVSAGRTLAST